MVAMPAEDMEVELAMVEVMPVPLRLRRPLHMRVLALVEPVTVEDTTEDTEVLL